MDIGVIGIDHRSGNLEVREVLARAVQKSLHPLALSCAQLQAIPLLTCNRTEIYFSSGDLPESHVLLLELLREEIPSPIDHKLYSYFGKDCFSHLTQVTAGLKSAIVGETEIQGQVKLAYEHACRAQTLCKELHFLFQNTLKISKRLRREQRFSTPSLSLEHAVVQIGKKTFTSLEEKQLLLIGASHINWTLLPALKKQGLHITMCNRTHAHTRLWQQQYEIATMPWESLHSWIEFDWVICATKAPHHLIPYPPPKVPRCQLLFDLSVPRNIPEEYGSILPLWNIDALQNILARNTAQIEEILRSAELIVQADVSAEIDRFHQRELRSFA